MLLKAPVRIDLAGGFTDNVAYIKGCSAYLSSIALQPFVTSQDGGLENSVYVVGSGLAVSTALNLLELARARGGEDYLATTPLAELADQVSAYENRKYAIEVGKGDAYPIVFGGFNCWECQGHMIRRVDMAIARETLDLLEQRILLLYSGIPRESTESLEQFNRNYDSGQPEYRRVFDALSAAGYECAESLAQGNLDRVGQLMEANWEAEKIIAPAVSNDYLDAVYAYARRTGALGGKLSGAGGGGYFIFYSHERAELAHRITTQFAACRVQEFRFVHANVQELNARSE